MHETRWNLSFQIFIDLFSNLLSKNDEILQKITEKSKSSFGGYDISRATYSFRNMSLPDPLTLISFCSMCKEPSNQYCRNCDAPFCSMLCEANDEIHKETCANGNVCELKDTVELNQMQDDDNSIELPTEWIEKSNTRVKLTSFVDLKTVYVRPTNPDDDTKFIKLMNDVAKAAKTSGVLQTPKNGLLVLALFEAVYHRALILKLLNENKAIVAFIDFGNVDTVDVTHMKIMPAELKKRPRSITKFILKNVPDALCNDNAVYILFDLLNKSAEMTVRFDEPYVPGVTECDLVTAAFDSVNTAIINANIPNVDIEEDSKPKQYISHMKITGQNVSVLILDNSSLLYGQVSVIKSIDIDQFQRNNQRIQTVANYLNQDGKHITPRLFIY